ncbi:MULTISPECIES: bifunctional tetrahydrofolate synthase/dihydrofolate synthase [unclassified Bordetella]|uniref:bifunctional tetrahydrofolate synthase/dihydrofolate synthase n=1 Tax=unclassified Bordetella TaxID=2630031 RepID=UPI00132639FD|nr:MULTISPECIES: bifunctional tetrahydrofolate synthase/dihydrofolate synthase [unclassified Bordetella]MVW71031.1 bifunctional tetrahydrofolate synthase/dihydrofolate synthase [Bordetella sp. 15P40C-2]MVW80600.1 bifunctional tetrahydrofolate synthase/dihydrofolate synthase [Bordetella sp. 02P26C-1]
MSAPHPDAATPLPEWLQYLESIHSKTIDLGLDRVKQVADRLDLKIDAVKFIVGGTNGKGSTCAMLEAILLAAGYRVGLYTSPHLIDFNERARINGEIASDAALTEQFAAIEAARGDTTLTYFEFTTLAILRLFSQSSLDAVVLEVGLGGRLDAVNIIDADCAIITSVDLDHTDYLGDTREKIGWEKAHIFRSGRPAICSDPQPPQTLIDYANEIGAELWQFGKDFNYSGDRQQWAYGGRAQRRNALAYPALRGANQLLNASAALAALEAVRDKLSVPQQAVRVGLLQASVPGRFQILPGQPVIILDVAHNPHAAAVLAQNLDNMGFHPYTHAVVGMLNDKDVDGVLAKLRGRIDHWYCAGLPGPRGSSGEDFARHVTTALEDGPAGAEAPSVQAYPDPAAAFAAARERAGEGDRIVVFGSFLTVAAVLQALGRKV